MISTLQLETDIFQDIFVEKNSDGVYIPFLHHSIYSYNGDEPLYSQDIPLNAVLDELIETNSVPNGTVTDVHREELLHQLNAIRLLIEEKIDKVKALPTWQKPS